MKRSITFLTLLFILINSFGSTITATSTGGEWNNSGSWSGGVVPSNGDLVVIPSGSIITITNTNVNFNGTLHIYGNLALMSTGFRRARIRMNGSSIINVMNGGQIMSGGGGFFSNFNRIRIGSNPWAYLPLIHGPMLPGPVSISQSGFSAMPISLVFFNAKVSSKKVEMTWATASEENFDHFSVERSADGIEFFEIGIVNGMGNTSKRTDYRFTDAFPLAGQSYYRLKSIDFDGYTDIFDYVLVDTGEDAVDFNIYPNPVENQNFSFQTNNVPDKESRLVIFNSQGKSEAVLEVSSWIGEFDLPNLQPGPYVFQYLSSRGNAVKRIMIR